MSHSSAREAPREILRRRPKTTTRSAPRRGWLALLALSAFACAPAQPPEDQESAEHPDTSGQSYAQAIEMVCDSERLSGADPNDPLSATSQRDEYLVAHVKNPDGIYFLTVFRTRPAPEQAELLAREVKATRLPRCALLEALSATNAAASAAQ